MRKPYFTKYITVEGEIKEGDKWTDGDTIFNDYNRNDSWKQGNGKKWQLEKLFLCSRHIQVNDTYYFNDTETEVCDSEIMVEQIKEQEAEFGPKRFKVIGEISPEASWVTEGMEFEEDDWRGPIINREHFKARYFIQIKDSKGNFK